MDLRHPRLFGCLVELRLECLDTQAVGDSDHLSSKANEWTIQFSPDVNDFVHGGSRESR